MAVNEANKPQFFYGWVIVSACFLLSASLFALYIYAPFFKEIQAEFGWTRAMTSSVVSVTTFMYCLAGLIVGQLVDKCGARPIIVACAVLLGAGLALSSQVHSIQGLYLPFGIMVGLGLGASFTIPVATVQRWFVQKRGLALGIQTAGVGIGVLILTPFSAYLIATYGWRQALIIIGIIGFAIMLIAAIFIVRSPEEKGLEPYGATEAQASTLSASPKGGWTAKEALRTKAFLRLWVISFLTSIPLLIVMVHIVPHAEDMGISKVIAAGALGLVGGFSIVGRLVGGTAADRMGFKQAAGLARVLCAIMMLFLVGVRSAWMIYLFAGLYGIGYGAVISATPGLVGHFFGTKSLPMLIAIMATGFGTAGLISPILGGYIFDKMHSYIVVFIIGAVLFAVAAVLVFTIKPPQRK